MASTAASLCQLGWPQASGRVPHNCVIIGSLPNIAHAANLRERLLLVQQSTVATKS